MTVPLGSWGAACAGPRGWQHRENPKSRGAGVWGDGGPVSSSSPSRTTTVEHAHPSAPEGVGQRPSADDLLLKMPSSDVELWRPQEYRRRWFLSSVPAPTQ